MPGNELNIAGFLVTALGAAIGMYGAFKQTNAYYPFKLRQFPEHLLRVMRTLIVSGSEAASRHVETAAKLGEGRGEDRKQSLIGLYCVLCGFFLQLLGAFLSLMASVGIVS